MGTRSLICIFYKGRFFIAQYTQFDGYPDGQGITIFKFIRSSENIERVKNGLPFVYEPTAEELAEINKEVEAQCAIDRKEHPNDYFQLNPLNRFYPSLSREAGGNIFKLIAEAGEGKHFHGKNTGPKCSCDRRIPHNPDLGFANDALFCEWAYVVDFDQEVFEVYGGSQVKSEAPNKRWNNVGLPDASVPGFVKSFSFEEAFKLTETGFIDSFKNSMYDDEEEEGEEEVVEEVVEAV